MKLNDEILKDTFSNFDVEGDPVLYRVYGAVTASFGKIMLLGSLSAIANKYYLIGFSKTRMIMILMDMLGKPKEPTVIDLKYIKSVKIRAWMFGFGKIIDIKLQDGSKIKFKFSNKNVMLKKQGENLSAVCDLLSSLPLE